MSEYQYYTFIEGYSAPFIYIKECKRRDIRGNIFCIISQTSEAILIPYSKELSSLYGVIVIPADKPETTFLTETLLLHKTSASHNSLQIREEILPLLNMLLQNKNKEEKLLIQKEKLARIEEDNLRLLHYQEENESRLKREREEKRDWMVQSLTSLIEFTNQECSDTSLDLLAANLFKYFNQPCFSHFISTVFYNIKQSNDWNSYPENIDINFKKPPTDSPIIYTKEYCHLYFTFDQGSIVISLKEHLATVHFQKTEQIFFAMFHKLINSSIKKNLNLAMLVHDSAQLIQIEKLTSLGTLAAGVAHEVNNPLTIILLTLKVLKSTHAQAATISTELLTPHIKILDESATRIANIIKNLKDYAQIGNDGSAYLSIQETLETSLTFIAHILNKNSIQVEKNYLEEKLTVYASKGQLQQVFTNLLLNSKDALYDAGIKCGKITLTIERDRSCAIIRFRDNGPGINMENRRKLFDPFFTTKAPGKGTGLGLSISMQIIQQFRGDIVVNSDAATYTEFTVRLPLVKQ